MNKNNIIHLVKKLEVADLAGEKVMIDFDTGKYFLLKGSANEIWAFIQSPISIGEIVTNLLEIYDVKEEECLTSTITFLNQLQKNNFISLV